MRTIINRWGSLLAAACVLFGASSCRRNEDDPVAPEPVNEEELITALELHFTSSGGTEQKLMSFMDADGAGGTSPVVLADTLSADSVYTVQAVLYREGADLPEDITGEILAEATDHQFFFAVNVANASITYADVDANGHPVGLLTNWAMGAASTGIVTVTLRHQPDKSAAGVSGGDITNAGGETDIDVALPLVIG